MKNKDIYLGKQGLHLYTFSTIYDHYVLFLKVENLQPHVLIRGVIDDPSGLQR